MYLCTVYCPVVVPPYTNKHKVLSTPWSYPEDIVSQTVSDELKEHERFIDLCQGPPAYEGDTEYINRIKIDLGIKVRDVMWHTQP